MRWARAAIWVGAVLAMPALADPPARSLIPVPRPDLPPGALSRPVTPDALAIAAAVSEAMATGAAGAARASVLPAGLLAAIGGQSRPGQAGPAAVRRSLRPQFRPAGPPRPATAPAHTGTPAQATASGGLCGVPGITGERLAPIPGRLNGCGIAEPVRISAINGITLSQRPTLNCQAARALQGWLTEDVAPEIGRRGGGLTSIRVISSYSCRTRNNRPGARLSEHATGNAIDIAGFGLANGREITVLSDWGRGAEGRILRRLHEAACGRFGTVLGPNADRFHRDHFHVDAASYRGGAYCR